MNFESPSAPSTPAAPTVAQNMKDYVDNYPALMDMQLKYAPQQAQSQVDLASKFAPQMKAIQDALYPTQSKLTEQLAGVAQQGMQSGVPQYMKDTYLDSMRAELGNNVGSGIAADYVSRNLVNQNEQYKQYYNNLAATTAGLQQVNYQSNNYQAPNLMQGYNYSQVANNNTQGYGSYVGAYSNMYNTNGQVANNNNNLMQGYLMGTSANKGGAIGGMAAFMGM